MTFEDYHQEFDAILAGENTEKPYDNEHFVDYVKLNQSRQNRWLKKGILSSETISTIQSIDKKQTWILITEPWCGDAAHNVPFIVKMAELNSNIQLVIQYRDGKNSEIDNYLTNGGKSIPILIVRNELNEDLFIWGPRPEDCQLLFHTLKAENLSVDEQKIGLQEWYNENQGVAIQTEFIRMLESIK